jgi:hypothetical protein
VNWVFALVVVVVVATIGFLNWDASFRGLRGAPLLLSIAAILMLAAAGVARGAGATGAWPLAGLIVGGVLFVVAERAGNSRKARRTGDSASNEPAP